MCCTTSTATHVAMRCAFHDKAKLKFCELGEINDSANKHLGDIFWSLLIVHLIFTKIF